VKESTNIYLKKKMGFFGYSTNKSSIVLTDFLDDCKEKGLLDYSLTKTDNNHLSQLFVQTQNQKKIFCHFPEIIFIDVFFYF
jgi:hypothetical protein